MTLSLILTAGVVTMHPSAGMAQSQRENTEARKLWNEGNELYNDTNFVEAEKKFREALTKYPKAEQSDRTAYYLIRTLTKLNRVKDARAEIVNFNKNYPGSRWRSDVDEENLKLGGLQGNGLLEQEMKIANERAEAQKRGDTALPPDASYEATVLRMLIQTSLPAGIANIKERLKNDPSDPAVIANLGAIFTSTSPQALPFLLELANSAASASTRNVAFFYAMRRNPDRVQVANTLMEMLAKKENEPIVSEALFRMTYQEHRAVLEKIVTSSNPDKFDAMEKIFRGGSITLRQDLLTAVSRTCPDSKAEAFISDAAQNDKDLAVRRAALEALVTCKGGADVKTLQDMLTPAVPPRTVAPKRGAAPKPFAPTIPTSLPLFSGAAK